MYNYINNKLLAFLGLKLSSITEFFIDYTTLSGDNAHILNKLYKFYQRDDHPLLIVIYGKYDSDMFDKVEGQIKSSRKGKNCRLIKIEQYTELFNFNNKNRQLMKEISHLATLALNDKKSFIKLRDFNINNPNIY